jgi:hypothetical protein
MSNFAVVRQTRPSMHDDCLRAESHLASDPRSACFYDENAKRFDLPILRRQLARLVGDLVLAERLRETAQRIAAALLGTTTTPRVAELAVLLESFADDEWGVDVTLPMLDLARLHIRGLVWLIEKPPRNPTYTDFESRRQRRGSAGRQGSEIGTLTPQAQQARRRFHQEKPPTPGGGPTACDRPLRPGPRRAHSDRLWRQRPRRSASRRTAPYPAARGAAGGALRPAP